MSATTVVIRSLAPELAEVARTELNEEQKSIDECVPSLRIWIEQHPKLKARSDDQFLVAFLRHSKYNLDLAKERIEFYYDYKYKSGTDLLKAGLVDDKMIEVCTAGIISSLRDPQGPGGPRIHFTRMGRIDPSIHKIPDIFRLFCLRAEMDLLNDDNSVISGVIEIIDCSTLPLSFLKQFDSSMFKKMSSFLENGLPINLIATHIVNATREVNLILNFVRLLMKQKSLLHIHTSLESLQSAIGKDYLPAEYGGQNSSVEEGVEEFHQQLLQHSSYFVENQKYGYGSKETTPTEKQPDSAVAAALLNANSSNAVCAATTAATFDFD